MKKGRKIDTQKSAIKKVAKSGSQGTEKHVTKKRERGITLIALVVTIIIMLILAAVTLNMALGDNGLIQMAKLAANKYEQAAINESLAMQELVNDLNNPWSVAPTTTTTPPPTTTTPSGGGGGTTEEQLTAKNLTKDDYGGYVDYKLDLNGDNDTTNDWRIFYVGENTKDGKTEKRIFLIAADYVPNKCETLKKAQKLAKMTPVTGSNYSICTSVFITGSMKYHCNDGHNPNLNSDKEQCSFPEIFMPSGDFCEEDNHYYCSDHVGSTGDYLESDDNALCASSLQCTGNWKPFVDDSEKNNCADYAIGGPTIEMWVASWNEKHGENAETGEQQGKTLQVSGCNDNSILRGYTVYPDVHSKLSSSSLVSTAGYDDTLYFPHKTSDNLRLFEDSTTGVYPSVEDDTTSGSARCYGYWLSSPSIDYSGYSGEELPDHILTVDNNGKIPDMACTGTLVTNMWYTIGSRCSSHCCS